jgi:hypothetical protein
VTNESDYAEWVRKNPPPDLQELVAKYGGYNRVRQRQAGVDPHGSRCVSRIPPEAWAEYDAAMAQWQEARRARMHRGK